MITVSILINGEPIFTRSAVNRGPVEGQSPTALLKCRYDVDEGTVLEHHPQNGAVTLAKMMLDTIKEQQA